MIVAVMPAYNEALTITGVINETKKYVDKIIVIDDCSSDDTGKLAKKAGAIVVKHSVNRGLGCAIRTGLKAAEKLKPDVVITIDADGQHEPKDIPRFIREIREGNDFVLGTRDLSKYPMSKRFGNFFLNAATNFISGTHLKDTESGYRAIKGSVLSKFFLKSERYEIAVEIAFEVGRNNMKHASIPIDSPVYVKGVGVMDGIKNFIFLLHRRERNWHSYIDDAKYVLKKWL